MNTDKKEGSKNKNSPAVGFYPCSSALLTGIIFASRDNFPTSAISVSLRQHTPQRSLPPPRSLGLTLIRFSLRLSVSAVNILWLRRRRAAFIYGQTYAARGTAQRAELWSKAQGLASPGNLSSNS